MKILGLICEYNPLHNGHLYHLKKAKELSGADYTIVVMSGDFVQRGEPALLDKFQRTKMALQAGVDVVLELPVRYATGSAEYFAQGGISLLHSLGCISSLCFGAESDNLPLYIKLSEILADEPVAYRKTLKTCLKKGDSYPVARVRALIQYIGDTNSAVQADREELTAFLSTPNNILGLEYCKALKRLSSPISPIPLSRAGMGYHDTSISETSFSSATAIREALLTGSASAISKAVPSTSLSILQSAAVEHSLMEVDDFSLLLQYKLMEESPASLTRYQDISPDLANRILSGFYSAGSYSRLVQCLKSKELTYTRISRGLLHILLNIPSFSPLEPVPYARILGFRRESSPVLGTMKKNSRIPLITNINQRNLQLSSSSASLFQEDIWCSNLYETVKSTKSCQPFIHERSRQFLKL